MQLYEQIRIENIKKYGTQSHSYMDLFINQYSDRTHFIFEILQNAEDADATYIKFKLYKERLVILHNGRPFTQEDVVGICGIADGTKVDGSRIGHFGIGFKSVYSYTTSPEIYSGNHSFVIKDQLFPRQIKAIKDLKFDETCMILPFDKEDVPKTIAFNEVSEALVKKITGESILILNNIADIVIEIEGSHQIIEINKEKGPIYKRNVYDLSILTTRTNTRTGKVSDNTQDYLFFTDAEEEATAIVFKVEDKEIQQVYNTRIFAYFPTAKESHQNFYIHAPFDTTPARDNFRSGEDYGKHNLELINNICKLINFALLWLRDNGYLSLDGLNRVFPIYKYDEDDMLHNIYLNSIEIINNNEYLLPTNTQGVFKGIEDICLPANMSIVNVFNDQDLQYLEGNRQKYWISKEIVTDRYYDLRRFLFENFKLKTYEWKDLVLKMDKSFLEGKPLSWMELLMASIESFCIPRNEGTSHYMNVANIPFVRLTSGKHICAKDEDNALVYLNNPDIAKYKIESTFRNSEIIISFYKNVLGVKDFNIETETIEKILPKYRTNSVKFNTNKPFHEHIEDLRAVKDAIYINPSIIETVKESFIVTDGKDWYKPGELHIRSGDLQSEYSLIKGFTKLLMLSERYYDDTVMIKLDNKFFRKIGCIHGLEAKNVSSDQYLQTVKKYCGYKVSNEISSKIFTKRHISNKPDWSINYEGFPEVFSEMNLNKSIKIANFLNKNLDKFDIEGELIAADDEYFSGSNVDNIRVYTMIGLQLAYERWIYVEDIIEPQRPIDVRPDQVLNKYKVAKRLMDKLPFNKLDDKISKWINENFADVPIRKRIESLLSKPEVFAEFVEDYNKSLAKQDAINANKGDLADKIKKGTRKQTNKKYRNKDTEGPEINPISDKALERRREKVEKELAATFDYKVRVTKGISFTTIESNDKQRVFLNNEYDGHCQMCNKKIIKHNGENYFEAINIIKPSQLYDKYHGSFDLAWNSLCLCPNCAAEYNHCSKSMADLYEQVMANEVVAKSNKTIDIEIELPLNSIRQIHYSPRHFMALKEALVAYSRE